MANASQLEVQNSWTTLWRSDLTHQHPAPYPHSQITAVKETDFGPLAAYGRDTNTSSDGRAVNLLVWCVVEELAACQKSCDQDRMLSADESLENGVTRLPVWNLVLETYPNVLFLAIAFV